jgi:hypothetical protein
MGIESKIGMAGVLAAVEQATTKLGRPLIISQAALGEAADSSLGLYPKTDQEKTYMAQLTVFERIQKLKPNLADKIAEGSKVIIAKPSDLPGIKPSLSLNNIALAGERAA